MPRIFQIIELIIRKGNIWKVAYTCYFYEIFGHLQVRILGYGYPQDLLKNDPHHHRALHDQRLYPNEKTNLVLITTKIC